MSDLAQMLKNMLDDPNTSQKLQSLLGQGSVATPAQALPEGLDPAMLLKITSAVKQMNSKEADNRTRLLCDLKPYISPARARRVDEAVNILKMLWVIDIFKDEGDKN